MKVLIIEDEKPAADKLERYLQRYDAGIEVLSRAASVKQAVEWLTEHPQDADLLFMDVQLTDGLSFSIFEQVRIQAPVIFTTAFNQYAMEAFKANGIDYLLKPVTYDALATSLKKLDNLREQLAQPETVPAPDLGALTQMLSQFQERNYKNRFMVKVGEHIRAVPTEQVHLFFAEGRHCYLVTKQGRHLIDYKLEQVEEMVDPAQFYRVNRSIIVALPGIRELVVYSNSRLKVELLIDFEKEVIVARDKVAAFKEWFSGS